MSGRGGSFVRNRTGVSVKWWNYDAKATGEDTMEVDSLMIVNQLSDPTTLWFSRLQHRQHSLDHSVYGQSKSLSQPYSRTLLLVDVIASINIRHKFPRLLEGDNVPYRTSMREDHSGRRPISNPPPCSQ